MKYTDYYKYLKEVATSEDAFEDPSKPSIRKIINMAFEQYPNAKKNAVENFLSTMGEINDENLNDVMLNLTHDAYIYRWNDDTTNAIVFVINYLVSY